VGEKVPQSKNSFLLSSTREFFAHKITIKTSHSEEKYEEKFTAPWETNGREQSFRRCGAKLMHFDARR
jgi:hypothetical protein